MKQFETITLQPDFPNEDLHEHNVPLIEFYLQEMHEPRTHATFLKESMRPLHLTAHHALQLSGVEVVYDPDEYDAFCNGFAAFEYISLLVNPRHIREQLIVKNVHMLLTANDIIPELDMADRRQAWMDMYPNVTGVITNETIAHAETLPQLYSRAIGAQIACEMQMAA